MKIIKMISLSLAVMLTQAHTKNTKECIETYQHSDFKEALSICMPLAEKNDRLAQFLVGNILHEGLGDLPQNKQAALKWLKKSADGGNASAQLKLGKLYCKGDTKLPINHAKAAEYLHKAAEHQVSEAQFLLAMCYFKGIGVKQNLSTAQHWYNQAVTSGLSNAQRLNDPIILRDPIHESTPGIEAYEIANKILMDEDDVYLEGDMIWRQLAAEKGHPQAQYDICLHHLKNAKSNEDIQPALDWLHKAAQNDHQGAQSHLAWLHAIGIDMPENLGQAVAWFQKACHPAMKKNTQPEIGLAQIQSDFDQAIAVLTRSVDDQDIQYAIDTIDRCAQQDLTEAQFYLAKLHHEGKLVIANKSLAAHLYEKAAQKGHLEAQYNLGWMHLKGDGIPRKYMQAYYWLSKANEGRAKTETKTTLWSRLSQLSRVPYS